MVFLLNSLIIIITDYIIFNKWPNYIIKVNFVQGKMKQAYIFVINKNIFNFLQLVISDFYAEVLF